MDHGDHFDLCEHWNVVRAIRDYGHFLESRLFAKFVGILPSDDFRWINVLRQLRRLHVVVLVVLSLSSYDCHVGS